MLRFVCIRFERKFYAGSLKLRGHLEEVIKGGMTNMKLILNKMCIVGVDLIYLVNDSG